MRLLRMSQPLFKTRNPHAVLATQGTVGTMDAPYMHHEHIQVLYTSLTSVQRACGAQVEVDPGRALGENEPLGNML